MLDALTFSEIFSLARMSFLVVYLQKQITGDYQTCLSGAIRKIFLNIIINKKIK